jgi:hypothetical protein
MDFYRCTQLFSTGTKAISFPLAPGSPGSPLEDHDIVEREKAQRQLPLHRDAKDKLRQQITTRR